MNYAYKTDEAVNELLKFKINFSETYKTYMFNNKWVNDIDDYYYPEKIDNIKRLLHKQLKNGLNQAEYLQNLLDIIWKRVEYIEKYKCYSSEFFKLYSGKISTIDNYDTKPTSNKDLFEKYKTDSESISTKEFELFNFLSIHSKKMNDFQKQLDFEKGLLLYTLSNYREILKDLHSFIYTIHMNAEYIDFNNLDFEIFEDKKPNPESKPLFHINLDKITIAHLFKILIDEKIFVFDTTNSYQNELAMKKFVEENFTYKNNKNQMVPIKRFNREYSEANSLQYEETKKQEEVLNYLIGILEARKNDLKK